MKIIKYPNTIEIIIKISEEKVNDKIVFVCEKKKN